MAEITLTVPDGLRELVENAWGGTLEEHLQARIDPAIERWLKEAPEIPKKKRLDKYDRLDETKKGEIDVILASAPEPVIEEDLELEQLPKEK